MAKPAAVEPAIDTMTTGECVHGDTKKSGRPHEAPNRSGDGRETSGTQCSEGSGNAWGYFPRCRKSDGCPRDGTPGDANRPCAPYLPERAARGSGRSSEPCSSVSKY